MLEQEGRVPPFPIWLSQHHLRFKTRTYYFYKDNKDDSIEEAWAIGNWLDYDTGLMFGDAPEPPRQETQIDRAADLLQALLEDGPMASTDLEREAQGAGISWSTMNRAKDKLGIVARRKDGRWYWALPAKEQGAYA